MQRAVEKIVQEMEPFAWCRYLIELLDYVVVEAVDCLYQAADHPGAALAPAVLSDHTAFLDFVLPTL